MVYAFASPTEPATLREMTAAPYLQEQLSLRPHARRRSPMRAKDQGPDIQGNTVMTTRTTHYAECRSYVCFAHNVTPITLAGPARHSFSRGRARSRFRQQQLTGGSSHVSVQTVMRQT